MTWEPGKSGNPNGYKGPRDRARREVFERIHGLQHLDALETLSTIQNDVNTDPNIRVAAASALAHYCHPKMQSTPTPRYIDVQLDVPEFTHVSDAENFLAKIALLVARGQLDIQQGQELAGLVKLWIDSQYAKEELRFKISPPETRDTQITITGGLGGLPGTNIAPTEYGALSPPVLNGHAVSEQLLSAPKDVVPPDPPQLATDLPAASSGNEFTTGELKAVGPHPLQRHHFAPGDAAQSRSDEPGQNSGNGQNPDPLGRENGP